MDKPQTIRVRTLGLVITLVVALLAGTTRDALAQGIGQQTNAPAKTASPNPSPAPVAKPAPKPAAPSVPSQEQALYLVRSTLLTLNDANRSGNYTVLRDLASPEFQAKNTAADLAQIFSDLRHRNFDLFAAALLTPTFSSPPALDANERLHLRGFFPTRPLQINFDLMFEVVSGKWRLFAIAVATPQAAQTQSMRKPFYGVRILSGTVGLRW